MIIGISGRSQSGKDTVGKIIQYLTTTNELNGCTFQECEKYGYTYGVTWSIKKFAFALNQMVSIATGISIGELEREDIKNNPLVDDWQIERISGKIGETLEPFTYRSLLQQLGTEVGRSIHPNFWVNCLMRDYDKFANIDSYDCNTGLNDCKMNNVCHTCNEVVKTYIDNWIITDVRFPNEAEAIVKRKGIVIRVNKTSTSYPNSMGSTTTVIHSPVFPHSSKTALDDYNFNYTINAIEGDIESLVTQVKEILIKEKIL